jgi:hypothetical protein
MKRKFSITLNSWIVLLALVGMAGFLGLLGFGEQVQAAGTSRLTIPAAAFNPWVNGQTYQNDARFLKHLGPGNVGSLGNYWYIAPISLPDGATLTNVIAHWYQESPVVPGLFKLQRSKLGTGNYENLAAIDSSGISGYDAKSTTTISQTVVNNSLYSYWVLFQLPVSLGTVPGSNVWACGVQIEFTFPLSMPAVLKGE